MLGFVAALGAELASGKSVVAQMSMGQPQILFHFALFAAASLIPEQVKTLELPKSLRFPFPEEGAKISEETTYNDTFPENFRSSPHRF